MLTATQSDALQVQQTLKKVGLRGLLDDRSESIGRKIREAELRKIPYMLIIGDKEAEQGVVSVRRQGEGDQGQMAADDFVHLIKEKVDAKA